MPSFSPPQAIEDLVAVFQKVRPCFDFKLEAARFRLQPTQHRPANFTPQFGFRIYLEDVSAMLWFAELPWQAHLNRKLGGPWLKDLHEQLQGVLLHEAADRAAKSFSRQTGLRCRVEPSDKPEEAKYGGAQVLPLELTGNHDHPIHCELHTQGLLSLLWRKSDRLRDECAKQTVLTGSINLLPVWLETAEAENLEVGDVLLIDAEENQPLTEMTFGSGAWIRGRLNETGQIMVSAGYAIPSGCATGDRSQPGRHKMTCRLGLHSRTLAELEALEPGNLIKPHLTNQGHVEVLQDGTSFGTGKMVRVADRIGVVLTRVRAIEKAGRAPENSDKKP